MEERLFKKWNGATREIFVQAAGILSVGALVLSLHFFCIQIADEQTLSTLRLSHRAALKLLARDIDDLTQQLKNSLPDARASDSSGEIRFQFSGGTLSVLHPLAPARAIPIENAEKSPFRASLGVNPGISQFVYDRSGTLIDQKFSLHQQRDSRDLRDIKDELSESSEVENTNLRLVTSVSRAGGRGWVTALDCAMGAAIAFGGILALWGRRRRRGQKKRALEWLRQSLVDYRFGRICGAAPVRGMNPWNRALLAEFENAFGMASPYPSGFSSCVLNHQVKLATWSYFKAKLSTMFLDRMEGERIFLGRLEVRNPGDLPAAISAFGSAWAGEGELVQCFYSDHALVFAYKLSGDRSVESRILPPIRQLMRAGKLRVGEFEASFHALGENSDFTDPDSLLSGLGLAARSLEVPSAPGGAVLRPHVRVRDGYPVMRTYEFNWVQIMHLESYPVSLASAHAQADDVRASIPFSGHA